MSFAAVKVKSMDHLFFSYITTETHLMFFLLVFRSGTASLHNPHVIHMLTDAIDFLELGSKTNEVEVMLKVFVMDMVCLA